MDKPADVPDNLKNQLEQVRDKLTETGGSLAATAAEAKDEVVATVVAATQKAAATVAAAKDDVAATMAVAKDKTVEAVKEAAAELPHDREELRAAGEELLNRIKRNPAPWIAGASVILLIWAFRRRNR